MKEKANDRNTIVSPSSTCWSISETEENNLQLWFYLHFHMILYKYTAQG